MKTIKLIFPALMAILFFSCKSGEVVQYEYKSTTMLGSRTIVITKDSVMTTYKGRVESAYHSRATLPTEWEELQTAGKTVKLEEISDLPSPTNKRQTDAAPFGTLYFTTKDSTFKSATFDGFEAHASLAPVMAVIQKISLASPTDRE